MPSCQELYQQANQLSLLEKLQLAELLLANLDKPDHEIDVIWKDEAQKRWQAYQAGELKTVSYDSVMQKYK
jgi:putative addiction module component (TIGR02574 family)